jgi:hypothetical protein
MSQRTIRPEPHGWVAVSPDGLMIPATFREDAEAVKRHYLELWPLYRDMGYAIVPVRLLMLEGPTDDV